MNPLNPYDEFGYFFDLHLKKMQDIYFNQKPFFIYDQKFIETLGWIQSLPSTKDK